MQNFFDILHWWNDYLRISLLSELSIICFYVLFSALLSYLLFCSFWQCWKADVVIWVLWSNIKVVYYFQEKRTNNMRKRKPSGNYYWVIINIIIILIYWLNKIKLNKAQVSVEIFIMVLCFNFNSYLSCLNLYLSIHILIVLHNLSKFLLDDLNVKHTICIWSELYRSDLPF